MTIEPARRILSWSLLGSMRMDDIARVRASLKKLGNPYAYVTFDEAAENKRAQLLAPESSATDGAQLPREIPNIKHVSGNPYAVLTHVMNLEEAGSVEIGQLAQVSALGTLPAASKAEFQSQCRMIFARYIPAVERGRLRPHHREFIARNESRSPTARGRLLNGLKRYDLSSTPGFTSVFNREDSLFTEEKLRDIERLADLEGGDGE